MNTDQNVPKTTTPIDKTTPTTTGMVTTTTTAAAAIPTSNGEGEFSGDDDVNEEDDEPIPMITNRGLLPSSVILLFFGSAVHFARSLGKWNEHAAPIAASILVVFLFEWVRRRARFTYGRIESRPLLDLVQLYQKQPYVRPDGTTIMATPVEAALVKTSVLAALYRKAHPEEDEVIEENSSGSIG